MLFTFSKQFYIHDIYDKHRSNDEENETQEDKENDSDKFTFTDEVDSNPSKRKIPTRTSSSRIQKNHPEELIIGDINSGVGTIRKRQAPILDIQVSSLSLTEPKNVEEAIKDEYWVKEMKEELNQIEKNHTWELVPRPVNKNVIGAKWVFRNKMDDTGKVTRNKARLVCKGYAQVEREECRKGTAYRIDEQESDENTVA